MDKKFHGWWVVAAAFLTFGMSTGLPYYNMPFFYDYYEKSFGWNRADLTLGFPLAALLTLWVGPILVHRFSPRKILMFGTAMTFLALFGFSRMEGSLNMYYLFWFIYTVGYIFSGPIPHQIMISNWFRRKRGSAMGIAYVGVGLLGPIGSYVVKEVAARYDWRTAMFSLGVMVLFAWPLAIFVLRDRPSDIGQNPDGDEVASAESKIQPRAFGELLVRPAFWLLLVGSMCSIGAIGSINQHMKLVFKDQGFTDQATLNSTWQMANTIILFSSIAGRLFMGWMADRFSKKYVMAATYFLVAGTIPLLLLVKPGQDMDLWLFAMLFGFGMGADYMLIPLMAAEQFGVNTVARAMAIILPTDTIGQTWFPWIVSKLRIAYGDYGTALTAVFVMAVLGAIAVSLLPKQGQKDETLHLQDAQRTPAGD
ncbi:MAG: MFS transporter [Candidatus Solibacter usitatus]|nr:MFS transporter [Candidatus Solibacter usitatus]